VEDIVERANKKLSVYQHINKYIVWKDEDFPRTSTGKVRKNLISQKLPVLAAEKTVKALDRDLKERKIFEVLKKFKKISAKKIKSSSQLERDLGFDSLDLIELADVIEQKYDVDIDNVVISRQSTLKEIEKAIEKPERSSYRLPFYNFPYWAPSRILRTIFQYILYPFIRIIYRPEVRGVENLKAVKEPFILAANHSSNLDTFAVLYGLSLKLRQRVSTLMSIEYHFNHFFYHTGPWWRRFLEAVGFYLLINLFINTCPLSRTHGFRQVMENIGSLLDRGWSILIYPEGRVTTDGKIKKFESGVGIMAVDMKVPVIPVKIEGLYNILRNGILPWRHWPRWPRVTVSFGKPIDYRGNNHLEITKIVHKKVKSL
jgi:long-chain acyl-CoA synthetase